MVLFTLELVLSSIAKEGYFLKFYFWIDLISTISLIADIGWVWHTMTGTSDFSVSTATQAYILARAGKGARIGTRAGRISRVVRFVRLIRIVRLYKNAKTVLDTKHEQSLRELEDRDSEDFLN